MKKLLVVLAVFGLFSISKVYAANSPQPIANMTSIAVSSVTAAGALATVTITTATGAGSYSTGYNTYISHVHIEMYATGTLTGGATPVTCTTTNVSGNPVFKFNTAQATGTTQIQDIDYSNPLQNTAAATNVVVSCPATSNVIWNLIVNYIQGS